jgi:hypothetical protein
MTFGECDRKASPECLDGDALWTAGAIAGRVLYSLWERHASVSLLKAFKP